MLPTALTSARTAFCCALLVGALPSFAAAQAMAAGRDSVILATRFADALGVRTASLGRLAASVFVEDVMPGEGIEAKRGMVARVRTQLFLTDGTPVRPGGCQVLQFAIGGGSIIDGVDLAVRGMRPGGSRLVVFGAERGYRDRGVAGEVPPGATLIARLQLLDVSHARFPDVNECLRT
ncbi:MAG TPA: FKBP-type peptidyl-prolyl cis-trans isomerase [Gemmatimonadaceae bacterium]|nr:FKBP-type peptidyl-prolyl cis-trans isomerase [Gemmatimonadaceae bacterium]